jgi:DNA-binding SARP family transcriptional activator
MEFRILGPLEVTNRTGIVALPGRRLRALLAMFLLHPNEAISADRLAQALWGEDAPATSITTVRVHVSRLRRALDGDADLLTTSPAGYRLRVRPGELDSERFEDLVDTARSSMPADPEAARAALRDALAMWRGRPLADLASASFAEAAIARLEDERLDALELRVEADLAVGRHDELVPELQALVDQAPLRERLHAQLMLALYRSGRQADALEAYRRLRAELVDALGIEPGTEARELEGAILRHDPMLAPPGRPGDDAPGVVRRDVPERGARRPSRRATRLIVLGTVVGVATGMAVIGDRVRRGTGNAASTTPEAAYRAQVVRVCQAVNTAERARQHNEDVLRRALAAARTTRSQREAILEATRATIARDGRNLADLRSLEPPAASRVQHLAATQVWDRNLERARRFAVRLDGSANRADLLRAIAPLTAARPAIERDLVTLTAGLQRLGGNECRIHGFSERPVLLPALHPGEPPGPDVNPSSATRQAPTPTVPPATAGNATRRSSPKRPSSHRSD